MTSLSAWIRYVATKRPNCPDQPKVVTDTDETELARQLERLERENAEVDGDDDAEEMEAKTED